MEIEEFQQSLEQLEDNYGKSWTPGIAKTIYDKFNFIEYPKWKKIIEEIVNTQKRLPGLVEVNDIYTKLFKSNYEKTEYHEECKYCNGDGFFNWEFEADNGLFYTQPVLCQCKNSENVKQRGFINKYAAVIIPKYFEYLDKRIAENKTTLSDKKIAVFKDGHYEKVTDKFWETH